MDNFIDLDSDDSIGSDVLSNASSISYHRSVKIKPKIDPKLDATAAQALSELLTDWKFEYLYPIFLEERIDVEALKDLRLEYLIHLCTQYSISIGAAIKFERCLKQWQGQTERSILTNKEVEMPIPGSSRSHDICVKTVLRESPKGKLIIRHYDQHNRLNDTCRSTVLEIINNYLIHNDIKMSSDLAKQISLNIVKAFPTEEIEMYYIKQPGKAIISKVLTKYYNALRTLKKGGLIEKRSYGSRKLKDAMLRHSFELKPEHNFVDHMVEIKQDVCTFERLKDLWRNTKNGRFENISQLVLYYGTRDILIKWPHYKKEFGYELIDIDFKNIYPKAETLSTALKLYSGKLQGIMKEKIREPEFKKILENLTGNEISTHYTSIFHLLHCLLPPVAVEIDSLESTTTKKRCVRYSIRDSQNSIFMIGETTDEVEKAHKEKHAVTTSIYPMIAILGTVEVPSQFIVYFDDVRYKFEMVEEALDCCFKIYILFHIKYPTASCLVWNFIQQFFYKIQSPMDKHHPLISTLIKKLNEND